MKKRLTKKYKLFSSYFVPQNIDLSEWNANVNLEQNTLFTYARVTEIKILAGVN